MRCVVLSSLYRFVRLFLGTRIEQRFRVDGSSTRHSRYDSKCNSVEFLSRAFTSVPHWINLTSSKLPSSDASCHGVLIERLLSWAVTSTPWLMSNSTTSKLLVLKARCIGADSSLFQAARHFTLAPFSASKPAISRFPRSAARCNGDCWWWFGIFTSAP